MHHLATLHRCRNIILIGGTHRMYILCCTDHLQKLVIYTYMYGGHVSPFTPPPPPPPPPPSSDTYMLYICCSILLHRLSNFTQTQKERKCLTIVLQARTHKWSLLAMARA